MAGSEGTRFCPSCSRMVHDFSKLTYREASSLLERSPAGLCARIDYDVDGHLLFRNEMRPNSVKKLLPVSLLSISALTSPAVVYAQARNQEHAQETGKQSTCAVGVRVVDPAGEPIAHAHVMLAQERVEVVHGETDQQGNFAAGPLLPTVATLVVEAPGFARYDDQTLSVNCESKPSVTIDVSLRLGSLMGEVVLIKSQPNPFRRAWLRTTLFFRRLFHVT